MAKGTKKDEKKTEADRTARVLKEIAEELDRRGVHLTITAEIIIEKHGAK